MNDFVGNILQNKLYACCYILLSRTRPKRRCTLICGAALGVNGAETSLLLIALNSSHPTLHAADGLSTLQMGITLQFILEFYIIITSMKLNPSIIILTVNSSMKSSKSIFQLVSFNWR